MSSDTQIAPSELPSLLLGGSAQKYGMLWLRSLRNVTYWHTLLWEGFVDRNESTIKAKCGSPVGWIWVAQAEMKILQAPRFEQK
jgi:hypothetical protein